MNTFETIKSGAARVLNYLQEGETITRSYTDDGSLQYTFEHPLTVPEEPRHGAYSVGHLLEREALDRLRNRMPSAEVVEPATIVIAGLSNFDRQTQIEENILDFGKNRVGFLGRKNVRIVDAEISTNE